MVTKKSNSRRPAASSPSPVRKREDPKSYVGPSVLFGASASGANLSNLSEAIAELTRLQDRGIGDEKVETVFQGTAAELESAKSFVETALEGVIEAIRVVGELVANVDQGGINEAMRVGAGWTVSGLAAVLADLDYGRGALAVARPLESVEA